MFINPGDRVPVSDEAGNTVFIRAKMDLATRAARQRELLDVHRPGAVLSALTSQLMLLRYSVLDWEGPAFANGTDEAGNATFLPCTRANIDRLDPDEPLVAKVLSEIGLRNTPRLAKAGEVAADPNGSGSDT